MPILMPEAPPAVTTAFLKGLPTLLAGPDTKRTERYIGEQTKLPTLADVGDPRDRAIVRKSLHVYSIGLTDAAKGEGAPPITPAGWRCFAGNRPDTVVMGRITKQGPDEWKMSSVSYGEWTWALLEATGELGKLPQVQDAVYELRVLMVAALSMEAFWLVSHTDGAMDLVIPFPGPSADKERKMTVETLPNYFAWLRPQALTALHGRDVRPPRAV